MPDKIEIGALEAKIDRLMTMMADDFDWKAYDPDGELDESLEDDFRECCSLIGHDEKWSLVQVGSQKVEDTPKALYRALYLMRPTKLDFDDMYKSGLLEIGSPDRRYAVLVDFWKYTIGLYFYAPADTVPPKVAHGDLSIACGIPGVDNGWRTTDPVAQKFFALVSRALNRTWMVYSGNDFEV